MCRYIGCTIGFILSGEPFQRNFNALHSGVILGTSKSTRRKIWRDYRLNLEAILEKKRLRAFKGERKI